MGFFCLAFPDSFFCRVLTLPKTHGTVLLHRLSQVGYWALDGRQWQPFFSPSRSPQHCRALQNFHFRGRGVAAAIDIGSGASLWLRLSAHPVFALTSAASWGLQHRPECLVAFQHACMSYLDICNLALDDGLPHCTFCPPVSSTARARHLNSARQHQNQIFRNVRAAGRRVIDRAGREIPCIVPPWRALGFLFSIGASSYNKHSAVRPRSQRQRKTRPTP